MIFFSFQKSKAQEFCHFEIVYLEDYNYNQLKF